MKDSIKANLIVFFLIAIISFAMSSAFASLTIHEENDSYKLISIENNSFEPHYIDEVPYIPPVEETNDTNISYNNTTDVDYNITEYNETTENITEVYTEYADDISEYVEYD